ncbi:MAG: hypothetical protein H6656_15395 [Ardenticatenaceae bacterium]|nr:hypothetical protein [Ardenticatenaceae bacterium]
MVYGRLVASVLGKMWRMRAVWLKTAVSQISKVLETVKEGYHEEISRVNIELPKENWQPWPRFVGDVDQLHNGRFVQRPHGRSPDAHHG